nr:hypothetical protein TTCFQEHN_TTCFQEHN_CDS_0003 [Gokushovirinae sp.]
MRICERGGLKPPPVRIFPAGPAAKPVFIICGRRPLKARSNAMLPLVAGRSTVDLLDVNCAE